MILNQRIRKLEKAMKIANWKSIPPRWVSLYKKDGRYFTHAPISGQPDIEWVKPNDWRNGYDGIVLFTADQNEWAK